MVLNTQKCSVNENVLNYSAYFESSGHRVRSGGRVRCKFAVGYSQSVWYLDQTIFRWVGYISQTVPPSPPPRHFVVKGACFHKRSCNVSTRPDHDEPMIRSKPHNELYHSLVFKHQQMLERLQPIAVSRLKSSTIQHNIGKQCFRWRYHSKTTFRVSQDIKIKCHIVYYSVKFHITDFINSTRRYSVISEWWITCTSKY